MQGKEASEQETKAKSNVGIDVSKCWLDAHVLPSSESLRVANDCQGMRQLKRWLSRFEIALVVVEATGKWHRPLCRSLAATAIPVAVVDPFRVRMFAKAQGLFAKNDRLDARVLAVFAAVLPPPVRPVAPQALEELKELTVARVSAVEQQTALKNQLSAAEGAFLKRQLVRRLARAAKDIAAIEREIVKRIRADQGLARRYAILMSVPGFGSVVAASLVANLAELGACTRRGIALLAGLAPIDDDSGQRQGARVIWGGRAGVRRILYLAAVTAARSDPELRAFYQRRIADGKRAKVALIAVARKLAVLANVLIHEDRFWEPRTPKHA